MVKLSFASEISGTEFREMENFLLFDSVTGDVMIYFERLWLWQKPVLDFFIVGSTLSNKKAYKQVQLVRMTCQMLQVQLKQPLYYKSYTREEAHIQIPVGSLKLLFYTENMKLCPIVSIKLTSEMGSRDFTTSIGSYAKMNGDLFYFHMSEVYD